LSESALILLEFLDPFFYTVSTKMSGFFLGSLVMEINLAGLLPEALLIDLPEIDAQHEEIFRRIEALKETCFGSGPVSFEEFESLLEYLKYHFATEERVAGEAGAGLRRSRASAPGESASAAARPSGKCATERVTFILSCAMPSTGSSATSPRKINPSRTACESVG
jgi:hypothetical protein